MPNWSGGASGATSGALAGTAVSPGWGTAIGGILGGTLGLFSGNKDKNKQISTQTPEQQQFQKSLLNQTQNGQVGQNYGQANDYLSQILSGDPEAFERFAAPYRTEFQERTLPGIAERFSGLGGGLGGGASNSSGFGQALGGAATQFNSNLAGLYAQLQQQASQQAFGQHNILAGLGLGTQSFQPAYQPGNLGFGGTSLSGILEGVSKGFGQSAGNSLSSRFSDMFSKNQQPQQQQEYPVQNSDFYNGTY